MQKGTIKVSVLYPAGEGKTFDMQYYQNTQVPLVAELLGAALIATGIDGGLGGMAPGSPAPFMAIGHLYFNSVEEFGRSFGPQAAKIIADLPNFTNAEPVVQINEVIS